MDEGEAIQAGRKRYVRWSDASGAELWVLGMLWLSGRLLEYEKAPPGLLRRLFG